MAANAVPAPAPKKRLWFLDNLRVALTVLVIFHHVGQAYGPTGGFWAFENPERWPYLGFFFWTNASFFMGLFFFIAGFFLPGSFGRNGPAAFLKDRFRRFGIPLVLFLVLVNPVLMYVSYVNFRGGRLSFLTYYTDVYFGLGPRPANWIGPSWPDLNFGHLWFIEHLLVYGVCYAVWRVLSKRLAMANPETGRAPGDLALLRYALALTAVSAITRVWFPIDHWIGFLGFIQMEPAHLPQYLSLFLLGTVACRQNWVETMPHDRGMRWLRVGLGAVGAALVAYLLRDRLPGATVKTVFTFMESFVAVGLSVGLIALFRARWNTQGPLGRSLSDSAYGAYLFHVPIVVALQYAASAVPVGPLPKFVLVGLASAVLSFVASYLLRKVPGASAVL